MSARQWFLAAISFGIILNGTEADAASVISVQTSNSLAISPRQGLSEAWWTGPIIAAGPETLPAGHAFIEPYLFDVITKGSETPGSQSYLLYGIAPRFTAGVLPSFSYAKDARADRHMRMGDITLNIKYRLTAPNPDQTSPSVAIVLQEALPTAPYDRLKTANSGTGNGAFSTLVGLYAQQYFWLPNGRIIRGRVNLTHKFVGVAHIKDISVYGTAMGFRGTARPGDSTTINLAAEYSVTKQYVLALDLLHQWNGRTVVEAHSGSTTVENPVHPGSRITAVVPSVEYNWNSSEGIVAGTRFIFKGHNSDSSITPVIAYNRFF